MIPIKTSLLTVSSGALASADYEISVDDQEHIMALLRDGLYTDKILAILREYGANAFDAHISIGKGHVPIKIILPTYEEHVLYIRDYGPGLSHDDVFRVYNKYGRSTKRSSNDTVGCLGIGSKSGFAYADSFTITSWHGGMKRVYVAVKYEDAEGREKCRTDLFAEMACDADETGVEIQIATKPEDRYEFERTARRLFKHMTPRPDINIELPAPPTEQTVLTHGVIVPGSDAGWVAVMGCVPYRINLDVLDAREVPLCLRALSGQLQFGIGEVAMSASREELKYTTATKTALVAKFTALVDEFVTDALKKLEAGVFNGWETRLRVQVLAKLDLPLPEKWKAFAEGFAKVTYTYGDFTIVHNKAACTRLFVTDETRLLIDDTGNDLTGYSLGGDDYVVRSTNKTPTELRTALDAALATSGLTGVKIELLSSVYWSAPYVKPKKVSNPKHRARMFQLKELSRFTAPWSDNWEAVTRVPTTDDVFVVIEGFKAVGYERFYREYGEDLVLLKGFGLTMPAVYGYKATAKKPVDAKKLDGTDYETWRTKIVERLLTPENIALIELHWRANPRGDSAYSSSQALPEGKARKWIASRLGDNHPLVEWTIAGNTAKRALTDKGPIYTLAARANLTWEKSTAKTELDVFKKRYPLLRRTGFRELWANPYDADGEEVREEWARYIEMVDNALAPAANNIVQLVSIP
jgi:hypothetical protein